MDGVTRLDIGLLDFILWRRQVNIRYIILRHILLTSLLNNRLLTYGGIITRILRKFHIPLQKFMFEVIKKLGKEAITVLGFHRQRRKRAKTSSAKNRDTLVAVKDDQILNDIFLADQLPDFCLEAKAQAATHLTSVKTSTARAADNHKDEPQTPEEPPIPNEPCL